jgi:aromatic-L-amino-acid decarboxylase
MEAWLARVSAWALDHVEGFDAAPAVGAIGSEGVRVGERVSTPVPEEPLPGGLDEVLRRLGEAVGASVMPAGPGYFAFVPGSGLYAAALADFLSGCVNRYTGVAQAAPALCRLEADVLAWLAGEFGYGPEARGLMTSGGSVANLAGLVGARFDRLGDSGDFRDAVAYTSTQAHHCVDKALRVAGIPPANLVKVPVDAAFRMDVDALRVRVAADRRAGLRPFAVVAAAGTTNTGAVDPLHALADLCAEEDLWLQVDGAYGAAFVLCDEGKRALDGIERADAIVLDPHKGLFLPFGTGCLLVRDGARLRAAHVEGASYMQDFSAPDRRIAPPSPADHGPELSRDSRGIRLWTSLMLHGAGAFRSALAEKLELARRFHRGLLERIEAGAPIECVAAPQLSIVAFRLARRDGEGPAAWSARNAAWLDGINARERVFLSSTSLPVADGDAFTLRVCVLGHRTHADRIDACLEDMDAALRDFG